MKTTPWYHLDANGVVDRCGREAVIPDDGSVELIGWPGNVADLIGKYYADGQFLDRPECPAPTLAETGWGFPDLPSDTEIEVVDLELNTLLATVDNSEPIVLTDPGTYRFHVEPTGIWKRGTFDVEVV